MGWVAAGGRAQVRARPARGPGWACSPDPPATECSTHPLPAGPPGTDANITADSPHRHLPVERQSRETSGQPEGAQDPGVHPFSVESLDVTDRDALLALADRHDISDIVHLAGSIPDEDPVRYFRTDTTGLLNALDAARTWGVRRFAVASSLGVYAGRSETRRHEELALPAADLPHLIVAFKKAVEPLATHSLQGTGVQPVVLRIGSIWGPLMDPESPFNHIPPYISAVLRGEQPQSLYADDGGDSCYAPDAGRAIALLPGRQTGPGDNPYLDITRLTHDTGFAPAFDVAKAVADYVAWRADNPR
ncbi:NAD-dependent epimerase/dehydratase family protein [Nonomuraea sp. NPDC050451]|uniref:NAD-dependent epimerase/dehydratase family protein n=1 Tax=Nonomuraea sp. NPDC050451 TaxID=3364364 RepID=UPI0037B90929